MSKLSNKIAVVTGASKGIGASIAKTFAAAGATVVVNYSSSRAGADKVVSEIVAAGGNAVALGANLSIESEVVALFAAVKEQFGRVDVLVNNAGVYDFASLEAITQDSYRKMFDTNVLGMVLATREAVALMPDGAAVVNISSVVSTLAPPMGAIYVGSKGAVDAIGKSLAKELAGRKIRVNTINPGMIVTEGLVASGVLDSEMEKMFLSITPLGRAGQPEDVALPALFLASEDARFITGETLRVSGGAGM